MAENPNLHYFLEHEFLDLLIKLVIIFLAGIIFAALAKKFKQPVVLGYIIGGMVLGLLLGPSTPFTFFKDLFGGFTIDGKSGILYHFSQIGVVLLLFLAGIDTNFHDLKSNGKKSLMTAVLGVLTPFLLVFAVFMFTEGDIKPAIAMGVVVTATSISISLQTLKELGALKSLPGIVVTGAAIIDDIIGLILITMLGLFMGNSGQDASLLGVIGKISLIFLVIAVLGFIIVKVDSRIKTRGWREKHTIEIILATIAFCLSLSFFAQTLGVSAIIGAYFGGLILSMTRLKHTIEHNLYPIAFMFFGPVFFISIGLSLDLINIKNVLLIGLFIGALAIIGKTLGAGLGAKLSKLNNDTALKVGVAMVPMGEVAFIVASLAKSMGILTEQHLAISVMVIIITSLAAPIMLKLVYKRSKVKE